MLTESMQEQCRRYDEVAAHWHMEPLVVTAHLSQPLSITRPHDLQFDGLLAHAILHALFEDEAYHLPDPREAWLWVPLPLAMHGDRLERLTGSILGEHEKRQWWWYACSTPEIAETAYTRQYWNKRFNTDASSDFIDFGKRRGVVITENGQFKAYHQPLMLVQTLIVTWHVVGDKTMIEETVRHCSGIGKKRAYGYGAVERWEVTPEEADRSLYTGDGILARPVPLDALNMLGYNGPFSVQYIAFRSPGWLPENQQECAL